MLIVRSQWLRAHSRRQRRYQTPVFHSLLYSSNRTPHNTGNVLYSKADGVASLREGSVASFELDTVIWLASMTKLITSVACLQAVESGLVDLDAAVEDILPEVGKYGIMTGFDDEKNEGIYEKHKTSITLR
jgi:CubicO group peptidase (beta-lactamase class C family)